MESHQGYYYCFSSQSVQSAGHKTTVPAQDYVGSMWKHKLQASQYRIGKNSMGRYLSTSSGVPYYSTCEVLNIL